MPDSADTRQRILVAAASAFSEAGFAAVRTAEIAERAGVGKGTIYEYWRSKEDLLLDACLWVCQRNEAEIDGHEAHGGHGGHRGHSGHDGHDGHGGHGESPAALSAGPDAPHPVRMAYERLCGVLRQLLAARHEQRLFSELASIAHGHRELMARAKVEFSRKMAGWREQALAMQRLGVASGLFRDIAAPEDAARLIVAAVDGLIWQQLWEPGDEADLADRIARAWLRLHLVQPERLDEFLR